MPPLRLPPAPRARLTSIQWHDDSLVMICDVREVPQLPRADVRPWDTVELSLPSAWISRIS
jgi:hypothetical protein